MAAFSEERLLVPLRPAPAATAVPANRRVVAAVGQRPSLPRAVPDLRRDAADVFDGGLPNAGGGYFCWTGGVSTVGVLVAERLHGTEFWSSGFDFGRAVGFEGAALAELGLARFEQAEEGVVVRGGGLRTRLGFAMAESVADEQPHQSRSADRATTTADSDQNREAQVSCDSTRNRLSTWSRFLSRLSGDDAAGLAQYRMNPHSALDNVRQRPTASTHDRGVSACSQSHLHSRWT